MTVQRELMVQLPSQKDAQRVAGPVRMCIGCRHRGLATDLLRVVARQIDTRHSGIAVAAGYVVVVDPERRLPGRGAWLHPVPECMRQADRRRAFGRALRVPGTLDLSALTQYLSTQQESSDSPHMRG